MRPSRTPTLTPLEGGPARTVAAALRLLVVEPDPVVRAGLVALLQVADGVTATACGDGVAALAEVRRGHVDVLLLPLEPDGPQVLRQLPPDLPAIVLARHADPAAVRGAIDAGAAGYLVHGALDGARLAGAVREAADGGVPLCAAAGRALVGLLRQTGLRAAPVPTAVPDDPGLTDREAEVMACVAAGMANAEVAEALVVSRKTVKNHLNRAYAKLDATDRETAVARFLAVRAQRAAA